MTDFEDPHDGNESKQMNTLPSILLLLSITISIALGQASLINPTGARSRGMGNTGYVISNDETCMFFNPALLGVASERLSGGGYYSREFMPADLRNSFYGISYRNKNLPNLGFSAYVNHYDYGEIQMFSMGDDGEPDASETLDPYYEFTGAIGAGFSFLNNNVIGNSIGLSFKYYRAQLGTRGQSFTANSNAVCGDIGYLFSLYDRFRFGFIVRNIGRKIPTCYNDSLEYYHRAPATIITGIGYSDSFRLGKLRLIDVATELSLPMAIHKSLLGYDGERRIQTGIEAKMLNTFSSRFGGLWDFNSDAGAFTWGVGLNLFNHFECNYFWSMQKKILREFGINHGFSISLYKLFDWKRADKRWWIVYKDE